MSRLVNYSSEEDQDDYHYKKGGERERTQRNSRSDTLSSNDKDAAKRKMQKNYRERSRGRSPNKDLGNDHHYGNGGKTGTPPRDRGKYFDDGKSRHSKTTNANSNNNNNYTSGSSYNNEDKYQKSDRRTDKHRDSSRDRREYRTDNKYSKDNRGNNRDYKDERAHDNSSGSHAFRKYDDSKRHNKDFSRDRDNKRESTTDYYRDDKHSRNDDKKPFIPSSSSNKDRFNSFSSNSRYDERKSFDDRNNDRRDDRHRMNMDEERRHNSCHNNYGSGGRKDDFDYADRKDRRGNNNDDRRSYGQRSNNEEDRSNSNYRSNSNKYSVRRSDDDRKYHNTADQGSANKDHHDSFPSQIHPNRDNANESRTHDLPKEPSSDEVTHKKPLPSARNFEALLSLPLSETALKESTAKVPVPAATVVADESTGGSVQLPNYYNPKIINATKYATQMQKRKMIWGSKKTEDVAAKWGHAQFSQDSDGKVASKFMRLMGIKNAGGEMSADESSGADKPQPTAAAAPPKSSNPDYKTREAMFSTMEHQYEVARQVTHTMRGVGLGFNSQSKPY